MSMVQNSSQMLAMFLKAWKGQLSGFVRVLQEKIIEILSMISSDFPMFLHNKPVTATNYSMLATSYAQ